MKIKAIRIDFIPHNSQRYSTCGDYEIKDEVLFIRVSDTKDQSYNCLVAIHEFVEWMTTDHVGTKEEDIMGFDLSYEEERELGLHSEIDEPGFDKRAPYINEHTLATSIEMMICAFLGISWTEYDKVIMSL